MTITQLEYIIAVDEYQSFAKASEKCFVTQPTLSMQIKKLEQQLNVILFDRTKKPLRATKIGEKIIEQARVSLSELKRIQNIIEFQEDDCSGEIKLGIIPTISSYLLPLFATGFLKQHPGLRLNVEETITEDIIYKLCNNELDVGILVTPINDSRLVEIPLYYEPFIAYMPNHSPSFRKELNFHQLDLKDLWLLRKGHCFRDQVLNICRDTNNNSNKNRLQLESGSLETLRRIVEKQNGYTLLPELATLDFSDYQRQFIKTFSDPKPVREVSIVFSKRFSRKKIIDELKEHIQKCIPSHLIKKDKAEIIPWMKRE